MRFFLFLRWMLSLVLLGLSVGMQAQTARQVNLFANDIVYDPGTAKIYASVPSVAGGVYGNTITPIDPVSGLLGIPVFMGSEPGKIARSDDGKYLYVALNGAAQIRRFNLKTQKAEIKFGLGNDIFYGPNYADDIEVQPGNSNVIAVSLIDV